MAKILKNYSYQIEFVIIDESYGETFTLDNDLGYVYILDDYFNNVSSIYKINFYCTEEFYEYMRVNAARLRYKISIKSVLNSDQNQHMMFNEIYVDGLELKPMTKPSAIYKDVKSEETQAAEIKDKHMQVVMSFLPREITIYNRFIYNTVAYNTNMYEMSRYLLNRVNSMEINLENPYNSEQYKQVILPPNNMYMSFKWLQNQYGLYPYGISVFSKNNKLTIKNKLNTDKEPNVYVNLNRTIEENQSENLEGTQYERDTNQYRYVTSLDNVSFFNEELVNEEIYGTKNFIYSRDLDSTYKAIDEKEEILVNDKVRFYYNNIKNDMALNEFFLVNKHPDKVTIKYSSADINMWDLNNVFKISIYDAGKREDKYSSKKFQVIKNDMLFKVGRGLANLEGNALLIEI